MTSCTPGIVRSLSRMAAAMSSCVQPEGHSLRGLSETIGSDSFGPAGSAADSPRPSRDTADFTPGTSIVRRMASFSIWMDSSSEMFGTRSIEGEIEPSFISGMNAVPRNGTSASVATKSATATPTVRLRFANARCSSAR